jgi:hypothetical protein
MTHIINSTLDCKTCGILWQRVINASKNMLDISNTIWNNNGRPAVFRREITVEKRVLLKEGLDIYSNVMEQAPCPTVVLLEKWSFSLCVTPELGHGNK